MFDLTDKNALVTGASGGIGGAIARALHAAGARVGLSGTRAGALDLLAGELGDGAFAVPADLSSANGTKTLVKDTEAALGGIAILVNNAGLTRDQLAVRMSDEDWQMVLDVNLTAAFWLSQGCLRGMMKKRWGRIVSVTSIVGISGNPGQANYAASKAALIGMSKSLAQEVASRNITVNCVAPGFIDTPMTEGLSDEQKHNLTARIPAGRLGEPADIAGACVFLASDEASYVTGQTLHVNGGMAMI